MTNNCRTERKIQEWEWEESDGKVEEWGRLMEPIVSYLKIMRTKKLAFEKVRQALMLMMRKSRIKSNRNNWSI